MQNNLYFEDYWGQVAMTTPMITVFKARRGLLVIHWVRVSVSYV